MWTLSIQPPQASGLKPVDVVVRSAPGATVRELATALARHLAPHHPTITHLVPTDDGPWSADQLLVECGLRNGDLLNVVPVPSSWATQPGRPLRPRALLRVVAGVDAGRVVTLTGSAATIGRGYHCTVQLDDAMLSRQHARILLAGPQPVVVDAGSAAGTLVDGARATGSTEAPWGSTITLGATSLVLEQAGGPAVPTRGDTVLRPPRFGEPLAAETVEVSAPPTKAPRPHLPWAMMLLPLIMGVGLFASGWNITGLAIVLGWPLVMLLDHWLQIRRAAKDFAADLSLWSGDLQETTDRLDECARTQHQRALADHPSVDDLHRRIKGRGAELWCRTSAVADFLTCRIGLGPVPAQVVGVLASGGDRAAASAARVELAKRRLLADAPVTHRLGAVTAVTGPTDLVDAAVRAMVIRLCADHSPVDVSLVAVLSSHRAYQETWLRWLPHTVRRTGGRAPIAIGSAGGQSLLDHLAAEESGHGVTVCLIDEAAGVSRRKVELLAAADRRLHLLWMGRATESVPACTDTLIDLTASIPADATIAAAAAGGQPELRPAAILGSRERQGLALLSQVDTLSLADAWSLSRSIHPYVDGVAVRPADTDLPERLRLPELTEDVADVDDPLVISERWLASRGLRAQLGLGIDGAVTIDLREDGPHALIAGTTGAGKSELLQTLLCSLAVNNPPSRITFLLVDYKGGAAFRECAELPHTVGYITDLNPAEVQRALVSLHAEITAREELLNERGVKDLAQLEARYPDDAPPSLLICVDEFAALTAEVPEFVDGMVNIAQRGRSLGLHLFLATQRPAGVVTANIQANTDLRIALRVASPDDSRDVLDRPDAADISRRTPGRAFLRRIGHGTTELIQTAWVGAREETTSATAPVTVRPFTAARTHLPAAEATGAGHAQTDLERLVDTIGTAFRSCGAQLPKKPWVPPLEKFLPLSALDRARSARAVPIGMVDEPRQQRQRPFVVDYAQVGNLLVYGASGAGKTELLRTVAVSGSVAAAAAPPHVYCLDFAGRGLAGLRGWPSVGEVVGPADLPQAMRLLRWLQRTVRQRNQVLADHHVNDVDRLPDELRPPRIHVLIDNLPALLGALENQRVRPDHGEILTGVLQDGRRTGVHITATTPSRAPLPTDMQATFGLRLVLRMNSTEDYDLLGVPAGVLQPDSPPGRGLHGRTEFQIALVEAAGDPAAGRDTPAHPRPVGIPRMPSRLPAADLPVPVGDQIPLAVEASLLEPIAVPLRRSVLLVAGRQRSGRTSMLRGIAEQALRSDDPPQRVVFVAAGEPLPDISGSSLGPASPGWSLILIDDADLIESETFDLHQFAKQSAAAADAGHAVIIASDSDHARNNAGELVTLAQRGGRGVLLEPQAVDDGLLGVELPYFTFEPMIGTGRGLWCWDGTGQVVQVVTA